MGITKTSTHAVCKGYTSYYTTKRTLCIPLVYRCSTTFLTRSLSSATRSDISYSSVMIFGGYRRDSEMHQRPWDKDKLMVCELVPLQCFDVS